MSIFKRIFGKKEEEEKPKKKTEKEKPTRLLDRKKITEEKKKKLKSTEGVPKETSQSSVLGKKIKKISRKEKNIAYWVLTEPVITEKSTSLGQFNKYVFKIHPKASKHQIKEAIQDYYGVQVMKVNTVKIHPKERIQGRTIGYKKGYKKAIVTLAPGDTIGIDEKA